MSLLHNQERLRYYAPVVVCLVLIALLLALPTGFEGALIYQGADRCAARMGEYGLLPSDVAAELPYLLP